MGRRGSSSKQRGGKSNGTILFAAFTALIALCYYYTSYYSLNLSRAGDHSMGFFGLRAALLGSGEEFLFSNLKGKVTLITNVASY